jgi:hypothetical protein
VAGGQLLGRRQVVEALELVVDRDQRPSQRRRDLLRRLGVLELAEGGARLRADRVGLLAVLGRGQRGLVAAARREPQQRRQGEGRERRGG